METTRMLHSAKSLDEQNQTIKRADKGNCSAQTLTLLLERLHLGEDVNWLSWQLLSRFFCDVCKFSHAFT